MNRSSVCRFMLLRSVTLSCALALLPSLFLVYSLRSHQGRSSPSPSSVAILNEESIRPDVAFQAGSAGLRPRHRFSSYGEYVQLQLNKTLNAKLRKVWSTTDWRRKINVFSSSFRLLLDQGLVQRGHKVMCIGARMGQEVAAFKEIGVADAIGIDLVPAPPLVIQGDIHHHPFADSTFDFEFSNVFDHALLPQRFVSEIERTLKPSGVVVLHVALHTKSDKFSVNDLLSVEALLSLFQNSDLVHIRNVDAFGLDTEVAMRKKNVNITKTASNCAISKLKRALINLAEPLLLTEPTKPWFTFKRNMRSVKYLPARADIANHRRYIYVDIGARDYGSSIGSWFQKAYPKQGHNFTVYAIEADSAFRQSYAHHAEVNFMPFAAWIRNESLMFGSEASPIEGNVTGNISPGRHVGMGRIHHQHIQNPELAKLEQRQLIEVQGLDIAEWISSVAAEDDFLVVKMDVEGAEYDLLPKLMETGVICLVDELFLECHYNRWQHSRPERTTKYKRTYQDCLSLFRSLRGKGVLVHQWW